HGAMTLQHHLSAALLDLPQPDRVVKAATGQRVSIRTPARQCTRSVCPESVSRQCPLARSHSLTLPSQLALARRLPSGAKANPCNLLLCSESVCMQRAGPLGCLCQSRIVPAKSPLASRPPSRLQASEKTGPGCGTSSRRVPNFGSQSRTVASSPPLASRLPSGEKARPLIPFACQL